MFSVTQGLGGSDLIAGTTDDTAQPTPVVEPQPYTAPTYSGGGGGIRWLPPPQVRRDDEPREKRRVEDPLKKQPRPRPALPARYIAPPAPVVQPPPAPPPIEGDNSINNPWLRAAVAVDRASQPLSALTVLTKMATTQLSQKTVRMVVTDTINKLFPGPKTNRPRKKK